MSIFASSRQSSRQWQTSPGYAVVDVETSGLSAGRDRILQVAVMQLDERGATEGSWSALLDPGCDPGPVHIHGLTREKLAGCPPYSTVAEQVSRLVDGRVLVAHNASFDWRFLTAEAERAQTPLTPAGRLCTMALTRHLDIPTGDLTLASVAQYWGVQQLRAHDAVDDTRVTAEILRHSLSAATRLGLDLPVVTADDTPAARSIYPPAARRTPCPWQHPGPHVAGRPLVQGMTVVFTGPTSHPRETLMATATAAGLDVMNSVSRRTSLVVTDTPDSGSGKARAAQAHGTAVMTVHDFVQLLAHVQPGTPKGDGPPARSTPHTRRTTHQPGLLHGRRVLVLGGPHETARAVRSRVGELDGQVAVNLSASVTDAIALDGAELDRRWARAVTLPLGWLDPQALSPVDAPTPSQSAQPASKTSAVRPATPAAPLTTPPTLPRGAAYDLPAGSSWTLGVHWDSRLAADTAVDVVVFVVDADEQVDADEDFCFFNNPSHPSGAVSLSLGTPDEALVRVDTDCLPSDSSRVVVAAALDGPGTFAAVGPIELVLRSPDGRAEARAVLDAASSETTLVLATFYDRNGTWRLRVVGQGYENDLASLATSYGVTVD